MLGMSNSSQQELERKINAVQEQLHPTSAASGGASVEQENASAKSSADNAVQDFDIDEIIEMVEMVEGKTVRLSSLAEDYKRIHKRPLVYDKALKLKGTLCEKLIEGEKQGYGIGGTKGYASFGPLKYLALADLWPITNENGEVVNPNTLVSAEEC